MTRDQWLKYVSIIERPGLRFTHQQKVKIISDLIDRERAEWDQIEREHLGLEKQVAHKRRNSDNI